MKRPRREDYIQHTRSSAFMWSDYASSLEDYADYLEKTERDLRRVIADYISAEGQEMEKNETT